MFIFYYVYKKLKKNTIRNEYNKNNKQMPKIYSEKEMYIKRLNEYKKELNQFLLTTRFNNETWEENNKFRSINKKIGCIYCSPEPIIKNIPIDSVIFILEMNNETNKIMGLGMIRNHPYVNKYQVYTNRNYNRYVYIGKNRIDRLEMSEKEEEIMKFFDIICFTGNKHMKRGQGLKSFPIDILYKCKKELDLVKFISDMFYKRLTKTSTNISL